MGVYFKTSLRNGGWRGLRACVGGLGHALAWLACLRGRRASVWSRWGRKRANAGDMLLLLLLLLLNAILKKKVLNVYFWNKNAKMFQIDLSNDLKEEPELKSRCCFTLLEYKDPEYGWIPVWANMPRYV